MSKLTPAQDTGHTTPVVALIGNPNVGKSSLFNALTGLRQHTGNWPGKTVAVARGSCTDPQSHSYTLIDLPGIYSLEACSEEEVISRDYILSEQADCIIVVGDATCLERNFYLLFQIMDVTKNLIFCVNLMDEANRRGIAVDLNQLQAKLKIPVIGTSATSCDGLPQLIEAMQRVCQKEKPIASFLSRHTDSKQADLVFNDLSDRSHSLYQEVVQTAFEEEKHWFDRIALNRWAGRLLMLLMLLAVFWITIKGANYPSSMLQTGFSACKLYLLDWTSSWPFWLRGILLDGIYETVGKVIAVMLPPMAIFFPLFTLLEDIGYLPRVAFMMDHAFERCSSCGKQSLTMAMGFGCNAAGVVGCRIITSSRERLIAILTNALVPCNGRFPALIILISLFFSNNSLVGAAILTFLVAFSVLMTLLSSRFLGSTMLKGEDTHFILEIPPYRKPKLCQILLRSLIDRTIFVLGRAVIVAAPMGAVIWLLQNIQFHNVALLNQIAHWLEPLGTFFGMNGVILTAFLLSFPANELFLPLLIMLLQGPLGSYEVGTATISSVLMANGWTWQMALTSIIFLLFHWPCSTTCLTIRKETGSWRWTLLSILLPTFIGLILCFFLARIMS